MPARNGRGLLPDFIALNQGRRIIELLENATSLRQGSISSLFDTRRNINDECGYPETGKITAQMFRDMWDREPIADRVVSVMPEYVWQQSLEIIEVEDSNTVTDFEEGWDSLPQQLSGGSLYRGDESNPINEYLYRFDLLAGVGSYGAMLLGIDDHKELSEPAEGIDEKTGEMIGNGGAERKLLYLQCFDQYLAPIASYEDDKNSPRYGRPKSYNLTLNDPSLMTGDTGIGKVTTEVAVHWSRIIHYAKNRTSSPIWGRSELLSVWNPLMDIQKIRGGDAEGFWRACYPGLSIESHPQLGGDVEWDLDDIRDDLEQFANTMQRWLAIAGASIKQLAPQIADPTAHLNASISHICIKKGIPRRVFEGSERGELASSQDAADWARKVRKVAVRETTPQVVVPFVDRLIALGVLPRPEQYTAKWSEPQILTRLEKAQAASARMDVMTKFLQGGVESLMVPHDLFTRELDYTDEEATAILTEAADLKEEQAQEQETSEPVQEQTPNQSPQSDQGQPTQGQQPQPGQSPSKRGSQQQSSRPSENVANEGDDCEWITMGGEHVCIKGGQIVKGPEALKKAINKPTKGGSVTSPEKSKSEKAGAALKPPEKSPITKPGPSKVSGLSISHDNSVTESQIPKTFSGDQQTMATMAARTIEFGTGKGIVAKDGDKIVGIASYKKQGRDIYVRYLASSRKGTGTQLVKELAKVAADSNKGLILEGYVSAKGFYEKIGMKALGKPGLGGNVAYGWSKKEAREFANK